MQVFITGFIQGHRWIFDANINKLIKATILYGEQLVQTANDRITFYHTIYNHIYDVMKIYINSDIYLANNIRISIINNNLELQKLHAYIYRNVCDYFEL